MLWTSKNISLSNNGYSSIIKTNQKMWNHGGEQLQGEQEIQPLCGRLWDQDWYNTAKVSRPFPLSFFDCYYLIHVWSLSCFMDQASWNSWNSLSFIGHVMVSRAHLKNHTVEKFPTLNTQHLILNEKNKGFLFLYLWGEERALRLRSVTTGQWPVANDSINKPISWNLKKCKNIKVQRVSRVVSTSTWCEGAVLPEARRLHTPPLPLCPTHLLHFTICEFFRYIHLRTVRVFLSFVISSIQLLSGVMEPPHFSR